VEYWKYMSDTVTVAIVSASGSVVVSITALLLNFRLFNSLERRIERLEDSFNTFKEMVNSKFAALDLEIGKIQDRIGPK
jgi:hypothetical protein